MNASQHLQQYVKRNVEGSSQCDLVILLYDASINSLHMGKMKLERRDIEGAHNAIAKAIRIVEELIGSLNMEKGGEIAKNLLRLYAYVKRRLTEANAAKEPGGVEEALEIMDGLRGAWKKAFVQMQGGRVPEADSRPGEPAPGQGSTPQGPTTSKPLSISV